MNLDLEHFKKKLEEEKKILKDELKQLGIKDPENQDWGARHIPPEAGPDRADDNISADYDESFFERSGMLGEIEIRYNNINDALKRIKEGTYGICEVGGEQIEVERLEANPAAKTCKKHLEK